MNTLNYVTRPPLSIRARMFGAMAYVREELQALGRLPNAARLKEMKRKAVHLLVSGRSTMETADALVLEELK